MVKACNSDVQNVFKCSMEWKLLHNNKLLYIKRKVINIESLNPQSDSMKAEIFWCLVSTALSNEASPTNKTWIETYLMSDSVRFDTEFMA